MWYHIFCLSHPVTCIPLIKEKKSKRKSFRNLFLSKLRKPRKVDGYANREKLTRIINKGNNNYLSFYSVHCIKQSSIMHHNNKNCLNMSLFQDCNIIYDFVMYSLDRKSICGPLYGHKYLARSCVIPTPEVVQVQVRLLVT